MVFVSLKSQTGLERKIDVEGKGSTSDGLEEEITVTWTGHREENSKQGKEWRMWRRTCALSSWSKLQLAMSACLPPQSKESRAKVGLQS